MKIMRTKINHFSAFDLLKNDFIKVAENKFNCGYDSTLLNSLIDFAYIDRLLRYADLKNISPY